MNRNSRRASIVANGASRKENFQGKEHLVVPVIAVREGVLNGMLALYEEIALYPQAWEGIPLPVGHPKKDGQMVTANTIDVLETQVIGTFFNVSLDEELKALKGELWIDIAAANAHADGPEVLRRLESNEPLEVSTAYFSDLELVSGMHNGERYAGIQRNMRPDHLALLPNAVGACSWDDGCGAPRVNHEPAKCACESQAVQVNSNTETSSIHVQEASNMEKKELVDQLITNAETPWKETDRERLMEITESELTKLLPQEAAPAVNKEEPKPQTTADVLAGITDPKVRKVIADGIAANEKRHKQLVAALKANKSCAFSETELEAMDVDFLQKLADSFEVSYEGQAPPRVNRARVDANEEGVPDPPKVLTKASA